jgi:hypothetical protein
MTPFTNLPELAAVLNTPLEIAILVDPGLGCRLSLTGVGETASRVVVNTIILIGNRDGTLHPQVRYAAGFTAAWVIAGDLHLALLRSRIPR